MSKNRSTDLNWNGVQEGDDNVVKEQVEKLDQRMRGGMAKIGAEGTAEELIEFYDRNAKEYEETRGLVRSNMGREHLARAVSRAVSDKSARLLECAAGTGAGAEYVHLEGFTNIDALEPSQGMLDIAKLKNIYKQLYCAGFQSDKQVDIQDDTYDALFFSASFAPGHLGVEHLPEMIRILKPGGVIIFNVPDKYLLGAEDFKDGKLDSALQSFVEDGRFESVSTERGPYRFGEDCNIYTIHVVK
ncbi:methyltransferase-like protein 27 [Amphiura filiformis]|uniref:methyltransferase-like protein 27 n=1 Tax=Amphiura filiformis TaxID=82378 RepID=UPI003B224D8D